MADTNTKLLQALLASQASLRTDLTHMYEKTQKDIQELRIEVGDGFKKVHERIDRIGHQLAVLDDDAPSMVEIKHLERRLRTLELKVKQLESPSTN